jgi:hypothetical protein
MSQHNLTLFGGFRQLLNEVSLRVLIKALLQIDDVLILINIRLQTLISLGRVHLGDDTSTLELIAYFH